MSSSDESVTEIEASPPKKIKWYTQQFNAQWLKDPAFKDWLEQDIDDSSHSYCKCCKVTLKNANKSMLLRHKDTERHKRNYESAKSTFKISQFFSKKSSTEDHQIAKSELLFAGYFAEHHIPFAHADHLLALCKRAFPDSQIASKLSTKQTKISYVMQDGIAFHEKLEVANMCRRNKFSIMIDESTDISVTQVLAVVVRYFDPNKHNVVDTLLDTVAVENGTAQGLFQAVKCLLKEKNIPFENIVGFGSDNCSSMMGEKSGFKKLLKDDIPSVFVMGCICHSMALCASHAVKVLPSYLEAFLKDVTSYFSRSSKRRRDFLAIQQAVGIVPHKMMKLAQTRWLSREKVIATIIEQYDALIPYFQKESNVDKVDGARKILETLTNCGTKHMLLFLQYILQKVNALNIEFQSEHFRLHVLHAMVTTEYKSILSCFIKDEVIRLRKLSLIDPQDVRNQKSTNDVYLGGQALAHLINQPFQDENGTKRFKTDCGFSMNYLTR